MNHIQKLKMIASITLTSSLLLASSASAFSDVKGKDAVVTELLHQKGIITGVNKDKFAPSTHLTGAQGIHMIVKALDLQNENQLNKQLKLDSNEANKQKNFWYSNSLEIAQASGIVLPENFKPNDKMTRELFANLLMQGIKVTGNYPVVKMYVHIVDQDQVNPNYMNDIQTLILLKIAALNDDGKFNPKEYITRIEAAHMVYQAVELVNKYKNIADNSDQNENDQVTQQIEKVNSSVNKVILTRWNQPNPGYGIVVSKVEFDRDTAIVYYKLTSPQPQTMYPQVITNTKTETYVDSKYKVVIKQSNN